MTAKPAAASGLARRTLRDFCDSKRLNGSEMAPQTLEMAQNGLGNGAVGSQSLDTRIDQANSVSE
jgi:hypothetical protein